MPLSRFSVLVGVIVGYGLGILSAALFFGYSSNFTAFVGPSAEQAAGVADAEANVHDAPGSRKSRLEEFDFNQQSVGGMPESPEKAPMEFLEEGSKASEQADTIWQPQASEQATESLPLVSQPIVDPAKRLLSNAQRLLPRYDQLRKEIGVTKCGMGINDGLALVSQIDLAGIDVLLESGTSVGNSAMLMARFFQEAPLQIITVDFGDTTMGGKCAGAVAETHARLKPFSNIRALLGDSFSLFPELIKKHSGRRIGLFIDGPKGHLAIRLCEASMKLSADVKFCMFHDVAPKASGKSGAQAFKLLSAWNRTLATTCCWKDWLQAFDLPYEVNSSMGIVLAG